MGGPPFQPGGSSRAGGGSRGPAPPPPGNAVQDRFTAGLPGRGSAGTSTGKAHHSQDDNRRKDVTLERQKAGHLKERERSVSVDGWLSELAFFSVRFAFRGKGRPGRYRSMPVRE
ncbi:hypothetical protein CDAR_429651 [Caerostris darwini]|uniref:Uncharacterized protein n=1 Tax=Caerostris darwini TaxID=1538125 RepID=A0AAV4VT84_9ARAC|nr:hypothetical protein CDAR_429651 [Caerostris darwini]